MAAPKSTTGDKTPGKPAAAKAATSTTKTTVQTESWDKSKIIAFCVILLVVAAVVFLVYKAFNPRVVTVVETRTVTPTSLVTTASLDEKSEPTPFTTEGARSWTEWMAKANAQKDQGMLGMWRALADLHFDGDLAKAYAAVKYQVTKESALGLDYYVRTVPAGGMPILNTSPKGKSYVPIPNRVLKAGDTYLVLDKDNPFVKATAKTAKSPTDSGKEVPAIRRKCANPIKISNGRHAHKSVKGPDRTHGAARQKLRDKNAVTTATPGYPGKGDQILAEQEATAGDTTNNGQVGHAGPAIGGTNSSGEVNLGGGASDPTLPGGIATVNTGDPGTPN